MLGLVIFFFYVYFLGAYFDAGELSPVGRVGAAPFRGRAPPTAGGGVGRSRDPPRFERAFSASSSNKLSRTCEAQFSLRDVAAAEN